MTHRKVRTTLSVAAMGLLAACSLGAESRLSQLDATSATGDAFSSALSSEYSSLARAEFAEFDYDDSSFFADKALAAAGGSAPAPQAVNARALPEGSVGGLTDARARLVAALDAGGGAGTPQAAAEAQAAYDCWLQEQEENIQPDDIAACRDKFEASMELVEAGLAGDGESDGPTPVTQTQNYVVYFDFNSADVNAEAQAVIDTAAERAAEATKVEVLGHTDASGTSDYNLALSQRRAESVAAALAAAGVDPAIITASSLGETLLAVSSDGPEASNRRAVINITE